MEIWIIGGIIVILMVIISTKIKRSAARAFEVESIETEEFELTKPEGFLHPLREPPDFPFEAYSKEYGERSTRNIWRCRARLRISNGLVLKEIGGSAKSSESDVSVTEGDDGSVIVSGRRAEDEVEYVVDRKIIESAALDRTYELRVTTLVPYEDEFEERSRAFLDSFRLKEPPADRSSG